MPVVAVATAAPAYAAVSPNPVVAGQCGIACKHPGATQQKTYHLTFCFTVNQAVDDNTVYLDQMFAGLDSNQAFAGDGVTTVAVVTNDTTCYYIDAPGFTESSTDAVVLNFHYFIGLERFEGCANGEVTGDVCGTSTPGSPLRLQPSDWPHDNGAGDEGLIECTPIPGSGC